MSNILDSFSALHNFKQREGLNPASAPTINLYIEERRLLRCLQALLLAEPLAEIAEKAGLAPIAVKDTVEDRIYQLAEEDLEFAVELMEDGCLYKCLRYIHRVTEKED